MMSVLILLLLGGLTYIVFGVVAKIFAFSKMALRAKFLLKDVPGPPSLPFIGSAHLFKISSLDFTYQLEDWARKYVVTDKVCGMIYAWVGPVPLIFCITPESVRPIFESNTNITKPTQYDILSDWIGTGLLTSTGEKWFSRRKMLTPTFHFNVLQGYQDVFSINRYGDGDECPDWKEQRLCGGSITDFCNCMGLRKRLSDDRIDERRKFSRKFGVFRGHDTPYRFPWLWLKPFWYGTGVGFEFDKLVKLTNDFTRNVIAQRKKVLEEDGYEDIGIGGKQKLAFLDLLLNMQKEKGLTDEDIREEVDTFMFEGHDTTSSGMGFTLWWIGQSPRVQQKVHEELDEVFGDSDRLVTLDDLKKLVYLEKCVKEALRLFPSVPIIARRLEVDQKIGCFVLPKGMTVVLAPIAVHRDPRWFEYPDDFYPEHFDVDKAAKRDPYAFVPFSAGARNCIGQKFAIMEEKTVLATILRKFHVETQEPWPGNRPVPEIILKPVVGFDVKLTLREHC